jgi:hypothetical protein
LFDGAAAKMTEVVRAVRIARLETKGAYDPEVHDDVLARFDWQAFSEDELLLMPQIAAVETGERLRGRALAAFSALLRSGRPVQVLVLDDTSTDLSGYHPGLGYIAVAHREAFVLQSTLAHPQQLLGGLRRMATVLSPAAALISVPSWSVPIPPWVQLAAMHFGRGAPLFRYEPAAGDTWADRFDLSENPRPELSWTTPETSYVDQSGDEHALDERFTFAHAAALDPAYRPQFRVIPREAWSEDQVPIADYLVGAEDEWLRLVPFIWVVDDDGLLARAVMTREMAFACFDRARAWRILQELGGADNEYARRAAHEAREQALAEAAEERAKLEAEHAEALDQAGRAAASDAMERLVAVLLSEDALTALSRTRSRRSQAAPLLRPHLPHPSKRLPRRRGRQRLPKPSRKKKKTKPSRSTSRSSPRCCARPATSAPTSTATCSSTTRTSRPSSPMPARALSNSWSWRRKNVPPSASILAHRARTTPRRPTI